MQLYFNLAKASDVPLSESINSGWMLPSQIGGKFSAMCWFFGRDLFKSLSPSVPVGLIETDVGGTPDQHWSSQDALDECKQGVINKPWGWPNNFTDSVLWNGKVVPLLRNVIRGAVWMQGESNANADGRLYNCSFQAMIKDWRAKWTQGTSGNTEPEFAFGWAQLNSCSNATHWIENATADPTPGLEDPFGMWNRGLQSIRLAQDATLALPSTFQAVILDTPVASGAIHSPYKQPAGARLARGALSLVYGSPQPYPKVCLCVIDTPPCDCTVRVCCDLAVDPCQTAVMNLPHCHWTVL
eukprot:m.201736 g.201736  ORF g.201736 m.201736 type:complete len:298 (+) comp25237_c0_seq1:50-943(+)